LLGFSNWSTPAAGHVASASRNIHEMSPHGFHLPPLEMCGGRRRAVFELSLDVFGGEDGVC
jgi:hypothetical protein